MFSTKIHGNSNILFAENTWVSREWHSCRFSHSPMSLSLSALLNGVRFLLSGENVGNVYMSGWAKSILFFSSNGRNHIEMLMRHTAEHHLREREREREYVVATYLDLSISIPAYEDGEEQKKTISTF